MKDIRFVSMFLLFATWTVVTGCSGTPASTLSTGAASSRIGSGKWSGALSAGQRLRAVARGAPLRVGLRVQVDSIQLSSSRSFEVRDHDGEFLAQVRGPAVLSIRARADAETGFELHEESRGRWKVDASSIRLIAGRGQGLQVDEDRFEGELEVLREETKLTLVEEIGLERYLEGVVPWEIGRPDKDAFAAVQAQAIAARTYAYAHLGHWEPLGFDLRADVGDQVYRGRTGTAGVTDRAVRSTTGQVLVYEGRLIRAYYSSTCGGYSSRLVDVWQKDGAEYLEGGADRYQGRTACSSSPHFRWTEVWSAKSLGQIVREQLPAELGADLSEDDIGALRGLEVLERDRSGRVQRLSIRTDRDEFEVWGDRIRWVLRPARGRFSILRSTMFAVEELRRDGKLVGVRLRGGGFGHGVGLCQTGALQRARWGQGAKAILEHYYRGARVVKVGSLDASAVALR